jgi:hypothetical protein
MTAAIDFREPLKWWVKAFNLRREIPDPADLDPIDIPAYLPFVAVWTRMPGEPLKCALVGESFREYYERSIRGEFLHEVLPERVRDDVQKTYESIIDTPEISLSVGTIYHGAARYWVNGFRLILPSISRATGEQRFFSFTARKQASEKSAFDAILPTDTTCATPLGTYLDADAMALTLVPPESPDSVKHNAMRQG